MWGGYTKKKLPAEAICFGLKKLKQVWLFAQNKKSSFSAAFSL
jgi:hypothetical protein